MSQPESALSRRRFLQLALAGAGAAVLLPCAVQAQLPPLPADDPTGKALAYTEDAGSVDAARFPNFKAGQNCLGCNFYKGQAERGACTLFPGKSVAGKGWCSAFAART
jgi:High potential iron-sulfur protein